MRHELAVVVWSRFVYALSMYIYIHIHTSHMYINWFYWAIQLPAILIMCSLSFELWSSSSSSSTNLAYSMWETLRLRASDYNSFSRWCLCSQQNHIQQHGFHMYTYIQWHLERRKRFKMHTQNIVYSAMFKRKCEPRIKMLIVYIGCKLKFNYLMFTNVQNLELYFHVMRVAHIGVDGI